MNAVIWIEFDPAKFDFPAQMYGFLEGFTSAISEKICGCNAVNEVKPYLAESVVEWKRPQDGWFQLEMQRPMVNFNNLLQAQCKVTIRERKITESFANNGCAQGLSSIENISKLGGK